MNTTSFLILISVSFYCLICLLLLLLLYHLLHIILVTEGLGEEDDSGGVTLEKRDDGKIYIKPSDLDTYEQSDIEGILIISDNNDANYNMISMH